MAVASQVRIREDGTVTKLPSLSLEKFRVTIVPGGFETVFVFGGFTDVVKLQVADDLSHAKASGSVPIEQCDRTGCHVTNFPVSFEPKANAPADFSRGRVVQKFGNCKIIDRFNFRSRTAAGSATVRGKSYPTSPAVPSTSTGRWRRSCTRTATPDRSVRAVPTPGGGLTVPPPGVRTLLTSLP